MKQKLVFNIMLAISILGASVLACLSSTPAPPHYGVFIEQGGDLIELPEQEIFGTPVEAQVGDLQTISDSQPTIVIWQSNLNLSYLEFMKLNQSLGQLIISVDYSATPREDGIIEITPKVSLENGSYCLIQGNPLAAFLSGWCFKIADETAIAEGEQFVDTQAAELKETAIAAGNAQISTFDVPSGEWVGEWSYHTGHLYTCEMILSITQSNDISGYIIWTLEKSSIESEKSKIGLTAIEYIRGTYDPISRLVSFEGYKKDDPNTVIGLDKYKLYLSDDGKSLNGQSESYGDWEGQFTASRKP